MAISARIDELKKKFDENPRRYFASLANEYRKAGDLDQALFICQEYLPQQPGHMSGHIVLAQTLYEMGRLDDAKAEFESALSLDPENLIALRHLGDIARQSGDPRTARNWYQRVLEADPRNSEIVDVLASLRTTPIASAAAISSIPPTPLSTPVMPPPAPPAASVPEPAPAPVEQTAPAREEHELLDLESIELGETPLSTPAVKPVTEHAAATPDLSMPVERSSPDVDLSAESFEADSFAIAAPQHESAPEPPALEPPIEPAADIELGLIDDDFSPASIADVEPTTLEGLRSYEAGTLIKGSEPIDKSLDTEPYYDVLHGSGRSTPPEAATSAQPTPPYATPPSDDDFATEMVEHFESIPTAEEHRSDSLPEPLDAVTPQVSATPVEGLESFEDADEVEFALPGSTPYSSATPVTPGLPVDSLTPVELEGVEAATPVEAKTPVDSSTPIAGVEGVGEAMSEPDHAATPSSGSEIFVTETMADLYLSQGHTDSALDIYRKLLEHRPDDARISDRVRELESRASGRTSRMSTPAATQEPVAHRRLSIREFLVSLAAGKSVADVAPSAPAEPESIPSNDRVSGSIDALFSGSDSLDLDVDSASPLAEAFSDHAGEGSMLEGQPAHPATSELSLDQVFKAATPVRTEAQPDGFSFDQFFAGENNASPASPPNANTAPAEGTDDIAQFNAWLNGLKKT